MVAPNIMLFGVFKGKYEHMYEQSEKFQLELKLKVQEILTLQEWRRRKNADEGMLKALLFPCFYRLFSFLASYSHDRVDIGRGR